MPCFHIVGITGTRQTFTSAVIWMPNSSQEAYTEALKVYIRHILMGQEEVVQMVITDQEKALTNALKAVFGQRVARMLCQFHIKMNVSTKGRKGLGIGDDDWLPVMEYFERMLVLCMLHLLLDFQHGFLSGMGLKGGHVIRRDL